MEISKNKRPAAEPAKNYKEKYEHLIGKESALDAAKKTVTNKSYGFGELIYYVHARIYIITSCLSIVPSENKKDQRSIEQTLADMRERKRQKTSHEEVTSASSSKPEEI